MSGVYISGMEMPTSEEKCKFYQDAPFRSPYCVIKGVCVGLEDCPLVPIPPHGRLIDADRLDYFKDDSGIVVFDFVTRGQIHSAPTIIPAEEGET